MRAEYYNSDEEKIVLPDDDNKGQCGPASVSTVQPMTRTFAVKPLKLEDVQGGFFLLGMGITITFIVTLLHHLLHHLVVKICGK